MNTAHHSQEESKEINHFIDINNDQEMAPWLSQQHNSLEADFKAVHEDLSKLQQEIQKMNHSQQDNIQRILENRNKIYSEMVMEAAINVSKHVRTDTDQLLNQLVPHLAEYMFDNFDMNASDLETMFGLKKLKNRPARF